MTDLPALEFAITRAVDEITITPAGDLDMATADDLAGQAINQLDQSPAAVTLDLRRVTFCDSAGINALIRVRNECGRREVAFRIENPHPHVRVLLEITGVADFLNLAPSGG